jgi:hypothetical protein
MKKTLFVLLISLLFGEGWGGVLLAQTPNLLVCDDKGYKLTSDVPATGAGDITYEWHEGVGGTFTAISSSNMASISFTAAQKSPNTYSYVRTAASESCTAVASDTFTVIVLAQPAVPTVTPTLAAVCYGTNVEFTASGAGTGATYSWTGASGAASGDGNGTYTFTSPATGTLEVQASASITHNIGDLTPKVCVSTLSTVASATVKPLPEVAAPKDSYVWCGTSNLSAMAVVVTAGGSTVTESATITWYDAVTAGNTLDTGASYTPPALPTELTSYFVGAVYDGCASANRTEVTATGLNEGSIGGEEIIEEP